MKSKPASILDQIVATKREHVAQLLPQADKLKHAAITRKEFRDFAGALRRGDGVALIAEVKKASPSAGVIRPDFDPIEIARQYEAAGAAALSVLTDEQFFQGRIEYLQLIRDAVRLPLLRKDFIIDALQVYEAAACGADAVLLIAAILDDAQLRDYRGLAEHLHMAALVEVHNAVELNRALASGAAIVGINNRNLKTFEVSLAPTIKLATSLRRGMCHDRILVAESGIDDRADVENVARAGVDAILVGESLMRSPNIAAKVKELLGHKD